jgi:hypothetical protein
MKRPRLRIVYVTSAYSTARRFEIQGRRWYGWKTLAKFSADGADDQEALARARVVLEQSDPVRSDLVFAEIGTAGSRFERGRLTVVPHHVVDSGERK